MRGVNTMCLIALGLAAVSVELQMMARPVQAVVCCCKPSDLLCAVSCYDDYGGYGSIKECYQEFCECKDYPSGCPRSYCSEAPEDNVLEDHAVGYHRCKSECVSSSCSNNMNPRKRVGGREGEENNAAMERCANECHRRCTDKKDGKDDGRHIAKVVVA